MAVGVDAADAEAVPAGPMARFTPEHRDSVSEKTQHESVALGELDAQYEQSPNVLSE